MIQLHNDIIRLRAPEPADLELLYQWENDERLWYLSNATGPFSRYTLEQYIYNSGQDIYAARQMRMMIDLKTGGTVGCIDLFDFDPVNQRAGVSILIDEGQRGKRYGSEALKLTIGYGFTTLGLRQLYCNICTNNQASLALFTQNGFVVTGTKQQWVLHNGQWLDEHILQLIP